MITKNLSGIILAGGLSRRLGRNKAVENFNNKPLLSIVYDSIKPFVNEIIIIVNNKQRQVELSFLKNANFATDEYNNSGSLGGIYTGLSNANNEKAIVVACDMPFISPSIISLMISKIKSSDDIIIPETEGFKHSTHAIYSKSCIEIIKKNLDDNNLKISNIFNMCKTKIISENEIYATEPCTKSFFNINNEMDLTKAKKLIK
jgi:molybdopterin-guanine dinucleotide biosynthesis protein A|tara:strand:+ start:262 stop:870 length:609 start_codon:yes stop_codon:yes gene_type:complete